MEEFFFNRHISRMVWFCFKEAPGWDRVPSSLKDIFYNWIPLGWGGGEGW